MAQSLISIDNLFSSIFQAHPQINGRYEMGPDLNLSEQLEYPRIHIVPQSLVVNQNIVTHTLYMMCIDIAKQDDNEMVKEVWSDTQQILIDVVKFIRSYNGDPGWFDIANDPSMTPILEDYKDRFTGHGMIVQLQVDLTGPCDIPIFNPDICGFVPRYFTGSGFQGFAGAQGPQGLRGFQGQIGVQGNSGEGVQGNTGPQGNVGDIGPQGVQGQVGNSPALNSGVPYNFGRGLPLDQDGYFRVNSILAPSVTEVYISISDYDSVDQTNWLQNISGGFIYIWKTSMGVTNTPSQVIYKVTSTTFNTTYVSLQVQWMSGTLPANTELCYLLTENTLGGPQGFQGLMGQVGGWTLEYGVSVTDSFQSRNLDADKTTFFDTTSWRLSAFDIYNNDINFINAVFYSIVNWLGGARLYFKIFDVTDSSKCWFYQNNNDPGDITASGDGFELLNCTYIGGSSATSDNVTDFTKLGISLLPLRNGNDGLEGPQGFQGDVGSVGLQGFQGTQGRQGVQGLQGFQGRQGLTGLQGFQGLGNIGTTGLQGFQGISGLQGFQGIQGATGSISIANDPGEQTYTGTITFTAGTQPSGATNHRYFWTRVGNCVQWTMILNWATGGTTVTVCSFALPTDMPAPVIPTGLSGASAHHYGATVRVAVSNTAAVTQGACTLRRNAGDTGEQITGSFGSGSWRLFIFSGFYWTI